MALKKTDALPKVAAKPVPQHGAEVKAAAPRAPDDDDRTVTHMGPGSGHAGAVDPKASAAILNAGKGTAPTVEHKTAPPAAESKGAAPVVEAKAAAPAAEAKAAPVQAAAEAVHDRLADDRLKQGASGDDDSGTLPTPRTPGQQTADGGTASTGPGVSSGGSGGSGGATSEGGQHPFGAGLTDRLDAAHASALSQLDAARPDLRGGLDVFQSTTGSASSPGGSASSHDGQLAAAGAASRGDVGQGASDPGAEHAADVTGQIAAGRGSTGALFGDRLAGAQSELDVMGGLLGDQAAKASSPSVADDDNLADAAVNTASGAGAIVGAAGAIEQAAGAAALVGVEVGAAATGAGVVAAGVVAWSVGSSIEEATRPATSWANEAVHSAFEETTEETAAKGVAAFQAGRERKAWREGTALPPQPGVHDSGDPSNPDGGMPTEAQIAFRESLRQALGGAQTGSGDIDPADSGGAPVGGSHFAGASNDNLGLVGQPAGTPAGASGSFHGPTTGTDVDPVEGSAFSGPALGGNPEDLSFGNTVLGPEAAQRATSSSSSDDEEEDDDDDDDE